MDGAIALEDGVVAEQVREADVGAERGGRQETGEEETGKAKRFHGGPRG
jgi:hypothetical protein